jgi:hypothetical protein
MAFVLQNVNIDLMSGMANVGAVEQIPPTQPGQPAKIKAFNVQFPFTPSGGEAHEKEKVVAAAKAVLQQALKEL